MFRKTLLIGSGVTRLRGKSLTWGRACQRWSNYEFTASSRYGYGIEWPINYEEIAPGIHMLKSLLGFAAQKME